MLMDTAYLYALFVNIDINNILNIYIYIYVCVCVCVYISSAGTIAIVWLCAEHGLDACLFDGC